MKLRQKVLQIFCACTILTGCAVGPQYSQPDFEMPCEWDNPPPCDCNTIPQEDFVWWKAFNDPVLECLIEQAFEQNLDLSIAAERILEARTVETGGKAALFPHLDASIAGGYARYDKKVLRKLVGASCCDDHSSKGNLNFFEAGFDASWELDLFGKRRRESNALKAQTEAAEYDFYNIWISLSAEVAKNYIDFRKLQLTLKALTRNIDYQQQAHLLNSDLLETGFSNIVDVRQAEAQLLTLEAQKPQIELEIRSTLYRLSILLGLNPGQLNNLIDDCGTLPELPCIAQIGIPSELLRRRPDVLKAERDLAAATEQVGSAVADRFPRLTLTGFIGDLAALKSGGFFTGYGGAQALFPLLNSAMIEQDITINTRKAQQALYAYQKTVLQALEETENALAALHFETERNSKLQKAVQANIETSTLVQQLYERGFKDYLQVVVTNNLLINAEGAYYESQTALLQNYVALYKALGGDFLPSESKDCN